MEEWKLEPAHDLHLSGMERYRSHHREGGLLESSLRLGWWGMLRGLFRTWNRLHIVGREHLPAEPPFVLVANHASHLDALLLTATLPLRWRDQTFPIAGQDVFFESHPLAAFAATFINAFPICRRAMVGHGLAVLRKRMLEERCIFIIFPEGTRTRDGKMNRFKAGIGMLVAATSVPVIPCYIHGAFKAAPPKSWLLRPTGLTVRLGPKQVFTELPNERSGWDKCAECLERAVIELGSQRQPGGVG
jgi:1-acyl-sn-glycerol-3-phosphate acyltransferase